MFDIAINTKIDFEFVLYVYTYVHKYRMHISPLLIQKVMQLLYSGRLQKAEPASKAAAKAELVVAKKE